MTKEEIMSWLNQHTIFESGYDITQGPFPLPASIGEGFKFQSEDFPCPGVADYIAKADRKEGKRVLRFSLTSFVGLCRDACHYFCSAKSFISFVQVNDQTKKISGCIKDANGKKIEFPYETDTLSFSLGIPLTQETIEENIAHYEFSEVGDCGTALRSKEPFFEVIEGLKEIFDMEQWIFEVEDR